jgi:Spy/CpxP family protein refolding chaperone
MAMIDVTSQTLKTIEKDGGSSAAKGWWRSVLCFIALAVPAGLARAEGPPEPPKPPPMSFHKPHDKSMLGADPIGAKLFPPDLIMDHQQELGIDQQQRDAILKEIERAHSQIFPLKWQMSGASEQLAKALDAPKIDEEKALASADKVMGLERELKRAHLALLIRIRNLLTDSQRAKAEELRGNAGH